MSQENAVKINDMKKNIVNSRNEKLEMEYYQHSAYVLRSIRYEDNRVESDVYFAHDYYTGYDEPRSNELNTDTAHMVDTFISNPMYFHRALSDDDQSRIMVNLSSFDGSLEDVRRRNEQAMNAVEAAEAFNRIIQAI